MRLLSLFTFATLAFSVVSALPLLKSDGLIVPRDDLDLVSSREIEVLETRQKHKTSRKFVPPPPPKITFHKGDHHSAHDTMDRLNLHAQKRKAVEDFHRNVVEQHMKNIPGAHTAVIKNLAHSRGSRDARMHISAEIRDKNGRIIEAPRHGNPAILDPTHHIVVHGGYDALPHEYKHAVDHSNTKNPKLRGKTGEGTI